MKASVVDLRYKTKDILNALDHNESVHLLYHGTAKGIIQPLRKKCEYKITEHPFFGMLREDTGAVEKTMKKIRQARYDDI